MVLAEIKFYPSVILKLIYEQFFALENLSIKESWDSAKNKVGIKKMHPSLYYIAKNT